MSDTTKSAVQEAADKLDKQFDATGKIEIEETVLSKEDEEKEIEEEEEEEVKDPPVKDKKEEEEPKDHKYVDDLEDGEVIKARQLWKSLRDPNQRNVVIDYLAKEAGYEKPPETKKQEVQQKRGIREYLKENLGEDFAFLDEKLGPALDKWAKDQEADFESRIQKHVKPITDREAETERETTARQAQQAQESLATTYYKDGVIPDKVLESMSNLMDQIKPEAGTTVKDYLENIFLIATAKNGGVPMTVEKQKKIAANKNNVPNNLKTAEKPQAGKEPVEPKSIKDAVRMAHESLMKAS